MDERLSQKGIGLDESGRFCRLRRKRAAKSSFSPEIIIVGLRTMTIARITGTMGRALGAVIICSKSSFFTDSVRITGNEKVEERPEEESRKKIQIFTSSKIAFRAARSAQRSRAAAKS